MKRNLRNRLGFRTIAIFLAVLLGISTPTLGLPPMELLEPNYDYDQVIGQEFFEPTVFASTELPNASESFRRNVELFPALWNAETGRTAPAFQWTGNNTHDLYHPANNTAPWVARENPEANNNNIVEEVFIELPFDTDGDGRRDFVRATIRRPIESERIPDLKLAAYLEVSPYTDGTNANLLFHYVTDEMVASPDTSHYTFEDVRSRLPRAADWPWNRDEAIYWDNAARNWRVGVQPPTMDLGVIPASVGPADVVQSRGNPVPVGIGMGGHVNVGGNFAQYMFVRGYVTIAANSLGNIFSDGFAQHGNQAEQLASIAVTQWLNGEARGFTCQNALVQVDPSSWSNGMVFMSGTSYPGSMSMMAAATGVNGLGAIIPMVPVVSKYYYHRAGGVVQYPGRNNDTHGGFPGEEASDLAMFTSVRNLPAGNVGQRLNAISRNIPSYVNMHADSELGRLLRENYAAHWAAMRAGEDMASGNYNSWWDDRSLVATADRVQAGVVFHHGLGDFNVMTSNFDLFYRAVQEHSNAPIKLFLHRGGHTGTFTHEAIFDWLHLWVDHFLYGIENNVVEEMPNVIIASSIDGQYEHFDAWPVTGSEYRRYFLNPPLVGSESAAGSLSFDVPAAREFTIQDDFVNTRGTLTPQRDFNPNNGGVIGWVEGWNIGATVFADAGRRALIRSWERELFNVSNLDTESSERLVFVTEITENVRMSGTVVASLEIASDRPFGTITAALVDIPVANSGRMFSATAGGAGVRTQNVRQIPAHNGIGAFNLVRPLEPIPPTGAENFWTDYRVISMGHANVQNPNGIDIINVSDFHNVAPGFENITRGRTYMEAGHQNFVPNFYFQSIQPKPGEFNTYVFSFQAMDWEFQAGDLMAIMVYTTDYRYSLTPPNPPEITVRTGINTFIDIPSLTPFNVTEAYAPVLSTTPDDFIRIGETARNSRQWQISFWVEETHGNGYVNRFMADFTIPGANANLRGSYVFGEGHILEGHTIVYDIRNNGSNIVTFTLR